MEAEQAEAKEIDDHVPPIVVEFIAKGTIPREREKERARARA